MGEVFEEFQAIFDVFSGDMGEAVGGKDAFVLTRPFWATFGDFLTKKKSKGGLQLGTLRASMVILALFVVCFVYEMYTLHQAKKLKEANKEQATTVKQHCIDEEEEEEA